MNILHDLRKHPFLLAASGAAFIHSAWTFATMFGGIEPMPYHDGTWWAWWLPGAFLAFSIDIGILSIAKRIRDGERHWTTVAVFIVLTLAMAYTQFVFMAVHIPAVPLAGGVRKEWVERAQFGLDSTMWVFPCFLPLALSLYAIVERNAKTITENVSSNARKPILRQPIFNFKLLRRTPTPETKNEGQKQPFLEGQLNGNGNHDATN